AYHDVQNRTAYSDRPNVSAWLSWVRLGTPRPYDSRAAHRRSLQVVLAAADLRDSERVRRHLHVPRSAPPEPGRGGPVPVPAGGFLGPVQQRLLAQRRPALSG